MIFPSLKSTSPKLRDTSEKRRLLRLNLSSEQFKHAETGKVFSVQDMSETGMALRIIDEQDLILFTPARKFEGHLKIKDQKYRVSAEVRYQGRDRVGCEFTEFNTELVSALKILLNPRTIGGDLRPVPTTEPMTLWYHATSGVDLVLKREMDGSICLIDIFLFGSYVKWRPDSDLETGQVRPSTQSSEVRGVTRFETLSFFRDKNLNLDTLKIAKELILGSILGNDLSHKILKKIT